MIAAGSSEAIAAMAAAVAVRRGRRGAAVTWFGEPVATLDGEAGTRALAAVIYRWAYCVGGARPRRALEPVPAPLMDAPLVPGRLEAWDGGWTVQAADGDFVRTAKDGEPAVLVPRWGIRPAGAGPGALVELRVPAVSAGRLPGWVALSSGTSGEVPVVRLYVNTRRDAAPGLARRLASRLLAAEVGDFTIKWLRGGDHDERCDSTVVYVAADAAARAAAAVLRLAGPGAVQDSVPLFTRRLTDGVGLAESPRDGASFGETRSRQVAYALARALQSAVPVTCSDLGFDLKRPWKTDAAAPEIDVAVPRRRRRTRSQASAGEELVRLADGLERDAMRSDGRAAWRQRDPVAPFGLRTTRAAVYDGTPGAVLVLAHATRITRGEAYRTTLRAAATDAALRAAGLGFHHGTAGTAAALAEAAIVAGDERLFELAAGARRQALSRLRQTAHGWDVVHGTAGSILGVVAASALLGEPPGALEAALNQLASRATRTAGTASWRTPAGAGRRVALAGLAHGASGAALALSAGDHALGSTTHQMTVDAALRFEDIRRRSAHGGWSDHRQAVPGPDPLSWCHGAAGIGLASAAIAGHDDERRRLDRAQAAAEVLAAAVERPGLAAGLCHGRAGAALALHRLGCVLDRPTWTQLAVTALDAEPPGWFHDRVSLMTGEAGHVLARLTVHEGAPPPLAFVLDVRLWRQASLDADGGTRAAAAPSKIGLREAGRRDTGSRSKD